MVKHFLSIIITCVFCLAVFTAQANHTHESLPDSAGKRQVTADAGQQKNGFSLQNTSERKMKAYPNPINRGSLLTIDIPADRDELTISLYNTVGKVIHTFKTSDKKVEFNVPDVSGIYLLRFVEKQKVVAVEKIIVKE